MLLKLSFCMFIFCKALIAQSVEHGANNARVAGSKPAESIFIIYNHRREKKEKKREEKRRRKKKKEKEKNKENINRQIKQRRNINKTK